MTSYGRVARLTALALATGTLVAAGAGTAGATTVSTVALAGTTQGSVLSIEINLPAGISVPGVLGNHIVQTISLTDGAVANGTGDAATGHAALGKGDVTDLVSTHLPLGALFPEVTSTLANPAQQVKGIDLSQPENGLTLRLLPTTSKVTDPNASDNATLSQSHTAVDEIKLEVPGLATSLPNALAPVTSTLNTVVGTVQQPAGQVTDAVNNAISTLNGAAGGALPAATVQQVTSTLQSTLTGLQNLPQAMAGANTALVDIHQVTSDQAVTRAGSVVSASSNNALTNIGLLGGLVTIDALKSGVTASVDSATKTATVAYLPESNQIVKVHVQGVTDLVLDNTGIHLSGLPSQLGTVTDTVNGAVQQLLATLNTLGISVQSGKNAAPTIASDGSGAAGSASGAAVVINPNVAGTYLPGLSATKPLLKLSFVNSSAGVRATKAQAVSNPQKLFPAHTDSTPVMAHTGADLALTGPIALGLMGLAVAARRRRLLTD